MCQESREDLCEKCFPSADTGDGWTGSFVRLVIRDDCCRFTLAAGPAQATDSIGRYLWFSCVGDGILPYLLNDTMLFVAQKTGCGIFSPSYFETPNLYSRLWEAFGIYPEEWPRILNFICLDGAFKSLFHRWMSGYDLTFLNFQDLKDRFDPAQTYYGMDWTIRSIHKRLRESGQHLTSARLDIKPDLSPRMGCQLISFTEDL